MSNKFRVETANLRNSSNVLEDKVARYNSEVAKLYSEVASLRVEWQGQSSDAFNKQIEEYRNDFELLAKMVESYSDFLIRAANNYEKTENSLTEAASSLNAGQ